MNASDLSLTRTFSTRLRAPAAVQPQLKAYATLFSKAVRSTFADFEQDAKAGESHTQGEFKSSIDHQFNLTSRQAYSVLTEAKARRDSLMELAELELDELKDRLKKQQGLVRRGKRQLSEHKRGKTKRLGKTKCQGVREAVFWAQTRVAKLKAAIARLQGRLTLGTTSMVFGTKKAARAQSALLLEQQEAFEDMDFPRLFEIDAALTRWRETWDLKRSGQFLVVGSKDETGGCQGCIARIEDDKTVTLSVKLPPALGGSHVELTGLTFGYGQNALIHALKQQELRAIFKQEALAQDLRDHTAWRESFVGPPEEHPKKYTATLSQTKVKGGVALTWRFMLQLDGSWQVSFCTDIPVAPVVTNFKNGAIGVDLNAGFLSVAETDGHGNIMNVRDYQTPDVGKSAHQREALQSEVVKEIIKRCVTTEKPLVLEDLDFKKKKRDLSIRAPESRRKLSSLAYNALFELICARARDRGVEVVSVDPAYTSTQGWVRYAAQRGWAVHQAAAGVIARRGQGYSERAPASGVHRIPVGAVAVELKVPVETLKSDVPSRWKRVHRALRQAIATHYRERRRAVQPKTMSKVPGALVVPGETPGLNPSP